MAIVVPNEGERNLLRLFLHPDGNGQNDYMYLRLYKNDLTPDESTVLGDFTEGDFSGYTERNLVRSEWANPNTDGSGVTSIRPESKNFSHDGGGTSNTIYGYYVIWKFSGGSPERLLWCERFSSSKTMNGVDDIITVVAQLEAA